MQYQHINKNQETRTIMLSKKVLVFFMLNVYILKQYDMAIYSF